MKTRGGFVSNSSSTCYILDLRKDGVKELVDLARKCRITQQIHCGRHTAIAVGNDVMNYAVMHGIDYGESDRSFSSWLMSYVNRLGAENIVLARESDEGTGGYLPDPDAEDVMAQTQEYNWDLDITRLPNGDFDWEKHRELNPGYCGGVAWAKLCEAAIEYH